MRPIACLSLVIWPLLVQAVIGQAPSAEDLTFFEQKVRPLLIEKCLKCHSRDSDEPNGGLWLDSRDRVLAGGDNGPAVVAGRPADSLLIRAIHYSDPDIEMPPDGKLSPREIAILESWVLRGVPYPDADAAARPAPKKIELAEGKKHWAFQPLRAIALPPLRDEAWPQTRTDWFIRAEQGKLGLSPSPDAAPAVLLRRAKFDLLGLPPSADEVQDFVDDPSPDAFRRRIDTWMASSQYGARWGRFWLELTRYCDIPESWAETEGNAYLYRDWVIEAFNSDMPFDRFAKLQLAADHLPDAQPKDLAALGFIGLSPSYWKELQLPVEIIKSIVSDETEERVHTFTSTFLGLNLACARCHDHKHDPFTVEDYYALAGVFASTRVMDRALESNVDSLQVVEARRQAKKLETDIKKLEGELKKLAAAKSPDQEQLARKRQDIDQRKSELEAARSIAGFDTLLAPGAIDATLEVKDAIGTHGSRLVYEQHPKDMAIEIRGNPNRTGATVRRRFIAVLSQDQPPTFTDGSGRRELAEAMLHECQALVARVLVNRIWRLHFGRGLVDTPSDFGSQGDPPSHPELLEDLARRFIEHDWSIKWLHTELMLSATYRQRSGAAGSDDPTDKFYTRAPLRRLEVEQWRDAMLAASGTLDASLGGPPQELSRTDNHRRTIFGTVKRRELSDLLRLYDFPDPITHSPNRITTTTPLQQLFTLNSPLMLDQAAALCRKIDFDAQADQAAGAPTAQPSPSQRIESAYQALFARRPSSEELRLGLAFLSGQAEQRWHEYVQVLLGSNEFNFVE